VLGLYLSLRSRRPKKGRGFGAWAHFRQWYCLPITLYIPIVQLPGWQLGGLLTQAVTFAGLMHANFDTCEQLVIAVLGVFLDQLAILKP